jgi:hypothetical protein
MTFGLPKDCFSKAENVKVGTCQVSPIMMYTTVIIEDISITMLKSIEIYLE